MAIKASAEITLTHLIDIQATYRYYLLQSSTLAAPSKPTTNPPPSSWNDAEPTYTSGSTNSLYYVDLTVFTNGDFQYSNVSLSTAYEAAKEAYNKAQNVKTDLDGMQIGGRNLLLNSNTFSGDNISANQDATIGGTYEGLNVYSYDFSVAESGTEVDILQFKKLNPEKLGAKYTLSFYAKGNGTMVTYFHGDDGYLQCASVVQSNGNTSTSGDGRSPWTLSNAWTRYWVTWTLKDEGDISIEKYVLFRLHAGANVSLCGIQLEKGNKPTDWTPTPEDVEKEIDDAKKEAAKTATNFMEYTKDDGLQIGNKISGSWSGKRAQILSDSFNIVDSDGTILSSFGSDTIYLGNNSETTCVNIGNDLFKIKADTWTDTTGNVIYKDSVINAPRIGLVSTERIGLNVLATLYDSNNVPIDYQSVVQAWPTNVRISASEYRTDTEETAKTSIEIRPHSVGVNGKLIANGEIIVNGGTLAGIGGNLSITSGVTVNGTLSTTGNATIGGVLKPTGDTLETDGNAKINGSFSTTGNTTIGGNLETTGYTTVQDTLTVNKSIYVMGSADIKSGAIELNNNGSLANYGGFIDFHFNKTNADYTSRIIEDASGQLNLVATNGVKINGSTVETGTWTAGVNGGSITSQVCTYMKVRNMCTISFFIKGKGGSGTELTNFYITGAPYTPKSGPNWYGGGGHVQGLYDTAGYPVTGCVIQPNKNIYFRTAQVGGTGSGYVRVNNGGANFYLSGSITYPIA